MEEKKEERYVLKFIQISDLHIEKHRNLLEPMIDNINRDNVDLVVVTGDTVNFADDKESFEIAAKSLDKIKHRVIVLPGDYDYGDLWEETFGDRFKALVLNGYCLEFIDSSFVRHRFAVGWGDVIESEDPEQYAWLKDKLKIDKYHFIFSHHPFWTGSKAESDLLQDNVRAIYSGHAHQPQKFYFKYSEPRKHFQSGFACVPLKFHGNSCYLVVLVKDNDEVINIPRTVDIKRTAW